MMSFDLDAKLMQFGTGTDLSKNWCVKHSVLGVQVFGSNGSGKTSSMKTLALKYLRAGYGFLVLSVKSERETWGEYCRLAGRSNDIIIIGENSPHRFDFMHYLSKKSGAGKFTSNLLDILTTVIKAGDQHDDTNVSDPFWSKSLKLLLYNTITLCQLAHGSVSIPVMYDIIQSAPQGSEDGSENENEDSDSPFYKAFENIRNEIAQEYLIWKEEWSEDEKILYQKKEVLELAVIEKFPKARDFKFVEQFFFSTFKTLSHKTKSIILLSVSSFLFNLLQDPIYTLFCSGKTTVTPESSLEGKIVILDLPTKTFHSAGRAAQLLYKYIWQLQVEKRDKTGNIRPVCLWADENAEWITDYDPKFQATARDSKVALVYICQNVHQYYAALGGKSSTDKIASFLGTLNTKIWFSNSCVTTNRLASELIGDDFYFDPSRTITTAKSFSQTDSIGLKKDRLVPMEWFTGLLTGGNTNDCIVEAYIHVQGDRLFNGRNFKKIRFNQNYK